MEDVCFTACLLHCGCISLTSPDSFQYHKTKHIVNVSFYIEICVLGSYILIESDVEDVSLRFFEVEILSVFTTQKMQNVFYT